jgi:hypothetical protein
MEVVRLTEKEMLTESEITKIVETVESYIFRRTICDVPTNALNKVFLLLHRDIVRLEGNEDNYLEKLKYVLSEKRESGRFPDDDEFAHALASKNIYNMRGDSKPYLFERLENHGTKETKDVWQHFDQGTYSVEHIMPQVLTPAWISDLGSDYERVHEKWLHTLANLTLTAYNSTYSNRRFSDKRDIENGFRKSGLRSNQWLANQEKWGEAELQVRIKLLQERALTIWKYPENGYIPPEKQFNTVTLDDEISFTGLGIAKYSLMGVERSVPSWTEMYQQVLIRLHETDKSILTRLAVARHSEIDLALHFDVAETCFSYCKEIDHNVFVWTATDTQYKISVLRKVFPLFEVDPTELVFYLRDEEAPFSDSDVVSSE